MSRTRKAVRLRSERGPPHGQIHFPLDGSKESLSDSLTLFVIIGTWFEGQAQRSAPGSEFKSRR